MAIGLCLALLFCLGVSPVGAAELDYNDYISSIQVDGDNDIVTVSFPVDRFNFELYQTMSTEEYLVSRQIGSYFDYTISAGANYNFHISSFDSVFLDNIPVGTSVEVVFGYGLRHGFLTPDESYRQCYFVYGNNEYYQEIQYTNVPTDDGYLVTMSGQIESHPYMNTFYPYFRFMKFNVYDEYAPIHFSVSVHSYTMTMSISSLYRLQQQTGKTNEILKQVEKQLADQGKTLDEVLQQQQQTNDKLDDMQGSIETLPGQIGDEMQGIIDNEKEESKNEGNKFVDQILDALPDPSQDVLAALKGLTDATAYTGTDAVLPIPAIVLPGIDGLFPETEIWGGTQFDFGEYISLLPSSLLVLVQSLFTIAIVIFCVYELKGIISYCLTLRESKGG